MTTPEPRNLGIPRPQRAVPVLARFDSVAPWLVAAIAIGFLYFARAVIIPITFAILLSFVLAPIVAGLRRLRVPRGPSVLLALSLALGTIALASSIIVSQASYLADDAPTYSARISQKITDLRASLGQRFDFFLQSDRGGGADPRAGALRTPSANGAQPSARPATIPVEVHQRPPTALEEVNTTLRPLLAPIESLAIILVVAGFILLQKEDLRDRVIRLMGAQDLHRTTVALDDGAKRLSRYFLSQLIVNTTFGAVIWLGLLLLGVPAPGLWGILAGLLRFIPYAGILIAALGPAALAAAVYPGWSTPVYVAVLFLVLDSLVGYAIEPFLYGRSTGLAPFSVVVAAVFWTSIWGPVGLILSMPLTLMLVALGRHIPAFEIFDVLLGDRPVLSVTQIFYQRVLAGHPDEAIDQAEELLETMTLGEYIDGVALPGLRLAAADADRGAIDRAAVISLCETTLEVIAGLADQRDSSPDAPTSPAPARVVSSEGAETHASHGLTGRSVACIPARGPLDLAVCAMAIRLLECAGANAREVPRDELRVRDIGRFAPGSTDAICILGLFDERSHRRVQVLARQIQSRSPDCIVLVGVWRGVEDPPAATEHTLGALLTLSELVELIGRASSRSSQSPAVGCAGGIETH